MVVKSWSNDEVLEVLAEKHRNNEIVEGVVRSLKPMKLPKEVGGKVEMVEQPTLIVALPGGVTGYCPASAFREREFRSYAQFVTHKDSFMITGLDLENQIAFLSANKAAEQLRDEFWGLVQALESEGRLQEEVFEATVTSYNQERNVVHARISGQDVYMFRNEWSWRERDVIDAQQGEKIQVKILLFDKENGMVRVSRRAALPDPYALLQTLQTGDIIAGRVEHVHPIHGLFVEVENGVVLKAGKVRALEQPEVGDFVSCRVQRVEPDKRRGKVIILSYPRGKRKKKDLGSFLFE